jgi:hypothetical protein
MTHETNNIDVPKPNHPFDSLTSASRGRQRSISADQPVYRSNDHGHRLDGLSRSAINDQDEDLLFNMSEL